MSKILPLLLAGFLFTWQCTDRISEPTEAENKNVEPVDSQLFNIISPSQYGNKIQTDEGTFIDALFIDFEVSDVWAIYKLQNGVAKKLSIELSFDNPLQFIMFTDKYFDQNQIGHYAVYAAIPEDNSHTIENITIAVAAVDDDELIRTYFETVQPTRFGEIINTVEGDFIEAFFESFSAEDVWGIQQTLHQGTKARINIARKLNRHLSYYLKNDSLADSLGNILSGVKVGLPYTPLSPIRNIEIFVSKAESTADSIDQNNRLIEQNRKE